MLYDFIAHYDEIFNAEEYVREDQIISDFLKSMRLKNKMVIDVGCGSGNWSLMSHVDARRYVGCDRSKRMLRNFKRKYGLSYRVMRMNCEDMIKNAKKEHVYIGLFSASYLDPKYIRKVINAASDYFFIFYDDGYTPVTHIKNKKMVRYNSFKSYRIGSGVRIFGKYVVVTNMRRCDVERFFEILP